MRRIIETATSMFRFMFIQDLDAVVPACLTCERKYRSKLGCTAFPDIIPEIIASGSNRHSKPFPGDHGIQYERAK